MQVTWASQPWERPRTHDQWDSLSHFSNEMTQDHVLTTSQKTPVGLSSCCPHDNVLDSAASKLPSLSCL